MKYIVGLALCCISIVNINAQQIWNKISESEISEKNIKEREIVPLHFASFSFDEKLFRKELHNVVQEELKSNQKGITIRLPYPDGSLKEFEVYESPCMSPVLSAKYPNIKSYRAVSEDRDHAKLDIGSMGFHAVIKSKQGTIYVDPYFLEPDNSYISYFIKDHVVDSNQFSGSCGVDAHMEAIAREKEAVLTEQNIKSPLKNAGEEIVKRKYRLAVATTGEWGSVWGTKENVMSRIVTGVTRLNMIFENEIATTFELVDNNDELIFLDPETDPYTDANLGRSLLGQNSIAINNIIGSGAYDIGHIFTVRCIDGIAGVAALGSVCLVNKGNGVSCVGGSNIANFMVNTTAHEIGHQFNGGHSWSNCPSSQGQLSPGTAWEPGSGSTILSYAGSCGSQNIASTNDDYFHVGNLQQFLTFEATTGSCVEEKPSGNHAPDISVPLGDGLVIPIATPFELEGFAVDEDGDNMTYNWEQMDLGPTSSLGQPEGNAPSFRSYPPDDEAKRLFPRLPAIIGGIGSNVEVLPLYSRDLTFRFVVRDNHPGAGAMVWEEVEMEASETAGPFRVTSPSSLTFVEIGEELDLEWDVANTDNDIINCQFVDIYLSTDNGKTFNTILKQNTPNDGAETIEIPNTLTSEGKIKIKASNNVFFQFNRSNIIIREPSTPGFYLDFAESNLDVCLPNNAEVDINGTAFQSFSNEVELSLENVPAGINYSFTNNPMSPESDSKLIFEFDDFEQTDEFTVTLVGVAEDADTLRQPLTIKTTGTNFSDLELLAPMSGLAGQRQIPTFIWSNTDYADYYNIEIATDPSFETGLVYSESFIPDTSIIPQIILDDSQLYYWRIIAENQCTSVVTETRTLGTATLDCIDYSAEDLPKNISFSGNVTVDATVRVFDIGTLADVNVNLIKGQHSDVFQLSGTLISPSGTEVEMFNRNCFASTDFNVGFDNDSPIDFTCPLNSGLIMKPREADLSVLEGENIDGNWIFRIVDMESGDGGQFTEFDLEICASFEIDNPYVINNDTLKVPTDLSAKLRTEVLLVGDDNNDADELIYTLVIVPSDGSLSLNGESLNIGDQFSQQQLSNGEVRYHHQSGNETLDRFVFTVIDGEGGWLDLTEFTIEVGDDFISSTEDILEESAFDIYPNPTTDNVWVQAHDRSVVYRVEIFDIEGRLVLRDSMTGNKSISVSGFQSGIYVLKLSDKNSSKSHRLQILR